MSLKDYLLLKLVKYQYNKETTIFKMFFDKHYRPDRFSAITNKIDSFNNVNEFRNYINNKYYDFPVKCLDNLSFRSKSKG